MVRQADLGFDAPHSLHGERSEDILVCGNHFTADPSGALFWPGQKTLIVADIYLGKASPKARKDRLLPPHDSRSTLRRLAAVMDRYDPDRVVVLGEGCREAPDAEAMPRADRNRLSILRQGREWYWVTETYGPDLPDWLGGLMCPALTVEGITFRHAPASGSLSHEIAGKLHPAARLKRRGKIVQRKCFVSNGTRLIVPAFGVYSGGLNVLDKAFTGLFENADFQVWALGLKKVYPAAKEQLLDETG